MSVAVGLETADGVWLAWDSANTCEDGEQDLLATKGFRSCGMGVAVVGEGHDLVLRYELGVEQPERAAEVERWAATALWAAIYRLFKPRKLHKQEWAALFAVRGRLVRLGHGQTPYCPLRNYTAIGSGAAYALGALHATVGADGVTSRSPQDRIEAAALAACGHDSHCREPISTLWCAK